VTSTMRFEQLTGARRAIILRGRSMPYRPISLARTQRIQTTWMPANPKAVQQVIGPTFEPTTLNGTWKDKYIGAEDSKADLFNFPRLSLAASGLSGIASSSTFEGTSAFSGRQTGRLGRVIADAFELLLAEGQDIRWQWDQYVRFGKLKRFVIQPGNPTGGVTDIGWELELEWSGDIAAPPIIVRQSVNLLATASGLSTLLQKLAAALDKLNSLGQPNAFVNTLVAPLVLLSGLVTSLISALRTIVSFSQLPSDLAKTVSGLLQSIRLAARGLANQIDNIRSSAAEASRIGACDAVQIAALVQALLRKRLIELSSYAAEQQRLLALFDGDDVLATFFADSATSLRDVATRFYGGPEEWVRISNFNAFYSSTVSPGTLVRVPRLT
jgi:hypothetical protein